MVPIHIYSGLDIPRNKNNCCEHLLVHLWQFKIQHDPSGKLRCEIASRPVASTPAAPVFPHLPVTIFRFFLCGKFMSSFPFVRPNLCEIGFSKVHLPRSVAVCVPSTSKSSTV
jgi:hypothetical protein